MADRKIDKSSWRIAADCATQAWLSTQGYEPKDDAEEAMLIERIKQAAKKRPRFGQHCVMVLLRKSGLGINHKRVERLWRQERLQVPGKRRGKGGWADGYFYEITCPGTLAGIS